MDKLQLEALTLFSVDPDGSVFAQFRADGTATNLAVRTQPAFAIQLSSMRA